MTGKAKTTEAKSTEARPAEPGHSETRQRLIETAERLFAERGIDAVSMRLINREAGQLNTSSIHYYFGSRDAVIEAVVERRMSVINRRRLALLEQLRAAAGEISLRDIVASYVRPLAAQSEGGRDGNNGGNYVRFLAQAYASAEIDIAHLARGRWDESLQQVAEMARGLLPGMPEPLFRERMGIVFRAVVYALADRERDSLGQRQRPNRPARDVFVEDLIDMQTAALRTSGAAPGVA
ncbi:MAG: TetR family transcriptional regulator [Alphaproteobacteria bacterium]|nr:TetR family transcriptional regulator [Alphaproteobacteria bacterium]